MSSNEIQHAWYEMSRNRTWSSVSLVPTEAGAQTVILAQELALVAARDPHQRVLVINATGTAVAPSAKASQASPIPGREAFYKDGITPVAGGKFGLLDCAKHGMDEVTVGMVEVPRYIEQLRQNQSPFTLILVAANAPVALPSAVTAARAADAVLLCVPLGRTAFAAARHTVQLVGEENVIGSLALRPEGH